MQTIGGASAQSIADPGYPRLSAETRGFSLGAPVSIRFVPDGSEVLFRRSGPRSFEHDLFAMDAATGAERLLLLAESVLRGAEEQLTAEELARRERMRMTARGIASYEVSGDGKRILVPLSGRLFVVSREDQGVVELADEGGFPIGPRFSPNGRSVAAVRDGELFVIAVEGGGQRQLTDSPGAHITNGLSEFIAQEEMGRRKGFWWSPDSSALVYQQTDTAPVETLYIADALHPERPARGWPYPRAGTANAAVRLGVVQAQGGETTWLKWDVDRYPYLVNVRWTKNAPLTLAVQNRAQTELVLLTANPVTGETGLLLIERDESWLNIDQKMPKWLPDGSGFLWTSERSGEWQLELRERDGRLARTLTPLPEKDGREWSYRGLVSLRDDGVEAIISVARSPLERFLARVSFAGESEILFSGGEGVHDAIYSPDHRSYVHRVSALSGSSAHRVYGPDGESAGVLQSMAEKPPFRPNVELTTVGGRKIHAAIIRPRNFDPGKRYPIIESVYGGPHANVVGLVPNRYLQDQWLADHGYVVVRLDARGTPLRGREWERPIKGDFISIPLQDHVDALKALGERYSEMDLSRVGIYGWSFGGYFSAMAVMRHPDVYHAGVAGAPVVDWSDYDTHYTERYLGLPQDAPGAYGVSSVLTYAAQLRRPLLIIHGTTDDNVYFVHSLKLTDALYRAGIDHEFLALSNFTHMVADPAVAARRTEKVAAFFERHLASPN